MYKDYIAEYNELANKYFSEDKINSAFEKLSKSLNDINIKQFNRFKKSVKEELTLIE